MADTNIVVDARKVSKEFTVSVQVRDLWLVKLGMFFLRVGCWIGGFSFVDEFPMSLIQPEDDGDGKEKRLPS